MRQEEKCAKCGAVESNSAHMNSQHDAGGHPFEPAKPEEPKEEPYRVALWKPDAAPDMYVIEKTRSDGNISIWGSFEYEVEAQQFCDELIRAHKIARAQGYLAGQAAERERWGKLRAILNDQENGGRACRSWVLGQMDSIERGEK